MIRALPVWLGLVLVGLAPAVSAAPWIAAPKDGWVTLRADRFAADVASERLSGQTGANQLSLAVAGTVGLPLQLELSFDLPYVLATNEFGAGTRHRNADLGDARVSVARALLPAIPLAAVLEAELPLYRRVTDRSPGGLVELDGELWAAERFPDVGDGQLELTAALSIGRSFYPSPAWVTASLGYRARFGPLADALDAAVDLGGWMVEQRVGAGLFASGLLNLGEDEQPLLLQSRQQLQVTAYLILCLPPLPQLSLKLGASSVLIASGGAPGTALSAAVTYRFQQ